MRPGHPYLAGSPTLTAHRGGAALAPENTIVAFRSALEDWKADILELDVRVTRDGEVVVIHDPTVDRTCSGSGAVRDFTWAELREMDAGHHFVDLEGRPAFRDEGIRIPRFEEVLQAFPEARLNVELKEREAARETVELVMRHGAASRVLIASEFERNRRPVRGYPGPWGASRLQILPFWYFRSIPLLRNFTPKADVLQVPEFWKRRRLVTPASVRRAQARNLPVHVWTVNDPDDMRRLLAWGVDGIQSDRPDLLAQVLHEECGRPLPPGVSKSRTPFAGEES